MTVATGEAGSPVGCDNAGARGVWYNFVAEGDGNATASITTPGGGGLLFTVNNGSLAGAYSAVAALFGGEFTSSAITADTAVVVDDDTTGDPNDACDPILNGASLAGKIAIVRRGACEFGAKVLAAENEGAIAVIVVNNNPDPPIAMGGGVSGPDVTIPSLMVSDVDGEAIIAEVNGGGTLNATMVLEAAGFSAVTFYTAPDENAIETDLVLVNWFENQCLPGTSASIPTVEGQAYYVYIANHDAATDIVIDGTFLGLEEDEISSVSAYPNPVSNLWNVQAREAITEISVYNLLGQAVIMASPNSDTYQVDMTSLDSGIYLANVKTETGNKTIRIIKQ
jgi:predicted aconitase with swiveling domain